MAKALVVLAHPLKASLCGRFAETASAALADAGHHVSFLDLAREGFDPRLTEAERLGYYGASCDTADVGREADLLTEAEILVLVFPTWWFSPPALMKGFIDRVFAPGVAFDHGADFGPIKARLTRLRTAVVISTFGSPWWVDRFVMLRPVRRMFSRGVIGACAPKARFAWLPFYAAENPGGARVAAFEARVRAKLASA